MSRESETSLTPQEAAQTLHELEHYEEALTQRSAGLTMMVWGIAVPGITMSYAAGGDWAVAEGIPWILSFLWLPWVLCGVFATNAIWDINSISLRAPTGRSEHVKGWMWGLGIMILLYALAGMVFLASHLFKLELNAPMVFAFAGGFLAICLGFLVRAVWKGNGVPLSVIGVLFTIFNVALAATRPSEMAASFASAAAVFVGYFGLGLYYYKRG